MSATHGPFPGVLTEKRDDVVVHRNGVFFIVRGIKRLQPFVPRPLFEDVELWTVVSRVGSAALRTVAPWFTKRYQCGVIVLEPYRGDLVRVLVHRGVANVDEAHQLKSQLLAKVHAGDFDDV